ncbi:MAG TPA: DUF4410 domain-containing protein [Candidatus Binataceae bacterium]|jgi:hypothetical protein
MKPLSRIASYLIAAVIVAGCASTKVTQQTPMSNPGLPRPKQIWVYDFIANPADMPPNASIGGELSASSTPPTAAEIAEGRQLGALIATNLVADIQEMGLPAQQAGPGSVPQVGDGVIRGYLVSVQGGSAAKRFVIGFGAGTSEMDTVVEGYAVTPLGWRKLGSGTLTSSGNKTPGMIMPAAVAIATSNPIGLIVVGGAKIYGEASGKNTLEGRAKATADGIAEELKIRFQDRGWIQ